MEEETDVFVERRFELAGHEVVLRFGRPVLAPTRDYRCQIWIEWPDRGETTSIYGIDAVQALLLAMRHAHSKLLDSAEYRSGQLTYLGGRDLGLPPRGE
jgi:hypothetical protein